MTSSVLLQVRDRVAQIVLNRPEKLNAFDLEMAELLHQQVAAVAENDNVIVLVVTGNGRAFCAGADVRYLEHLQMHGDLKSFRSLLEAGKALFLLFRSMPQMVIAAVNGPAAGGGCNLALSCDWRIASDQASFGEVFVRVGMHPDWGGYWILPRLVGPSKALEIMALGDLISAPKALELGLVNEVVPPDFLESRTEEIARKLADGPPLALRYIKRGIYNSYFGTWEKVLDQEIEGQIHCFQTDDGKEGLRAFLQKRKAKFSGR
ncbi:MAG: enoyl-CoA hydratase/isomerase family protein [Acidobacteria bacterium]|nr:enoyl-CoA hydratase/isomerase family protein [Acidobacteriota bacterium]